MFCLIKNIWSLGGSPGLVVMGGDSCSEGNGFKSQYCILDGHFITFICCLFEKRKINEKEAGDGPFLNYIIVIISVTLV